MEKEESFFIPWLTRAAGFESKLRLGTTSRLIGPGQLNHPVKERSGPKRCVGPDRPQPVSTSISSIPSSLDTGRSAGQTRRISETLSGTFIKRNIVERTIKAEIRPEEQSKKAESCQENFWNEIQLKGPQRRRQTQDQDSKEGASSVGHKPQHPHHVKRSPRGLETLQQTTTGCESTHSPQHCPPSHLSVSRAKPEHVRPHTLGGGLLHVRDLCLVPGPHVAEHALHEVQRPQLPC